MTLVNQATINLNNESDFIILHISDLHANDDSKVKDISNSIIRDFNRLIEGNDIKKYPDVIVISGDLAEKGALEKHYSIASNFILHLYNSLYNNAPKEDNLNRLIIVPGNHDVDISFTGDKLNGEKYQQRFNNFIKCLGENLGIKANFVENDKPVLKGLPYIEYSIPVKHNKVNEIQFIGINSAIDICYDYRDKAKIDTESLSDFLRIDDSQYIQQTIKKRIRVLVFHHAYLYTLGIQKTERFDYLNDSDFGGIFGYSFSLALHGHAHIHSTQIKAKKGTRLPIIGAGSLFDLPKERNPTIGLEYNIIVLNLNDGKGQVFPRRRDKDAPEWDKDTNWAERKREYYSIELNDPDGIWLKEDADTEDVEFERLDKKIKDNCDFNEEDLEKIRYVLAPKEDKQLYLNKLKLENACKCIDDPGKDCLVPADGMYHFADAARAGCVLNETCLILFAIKTIGEAIDDINHASKEDISKPRYVALLNKVCEAVDLFYRSFDVKGQYRDGEILLKLDSAKRDSLHNAAKAILAHRLKENKGSIYTVFLNAVEKFKDIYKEKELNESIIEAKKAELFASLESISMFIYSLLGDLTDVIEVHCRKTTENIKSEFKKLKKNEDLPNTLHMARKKLPYNLDPPTTPEIYKKKKKEKS